MAFSPLQSQLTVAKQDPRLMQAAIALLDNDIPVAERLLRAHLMERPTDIAAIRMLAEVAGRIGRYPDAENLLRRALELAPGFTAARSNLAMVLYRQNRTIEAIAELDKLSVEEPGNPANSNLKAAAHGKLGDYDEALELYEQVLARQSGQPKVWMSYGHVLKTVGRQADSVSAYRHAVKLMPQLGEVWWSLANLKTVLFSDEDIANMEKSLRLANLQPEDRFHLHFALGKALEDRSLAEASFNHYAEGNRLRGLMLDYNPADTTLQVKRTMSIFTPAFLSERAGHGCTAPDPIFIVGMPRAGSTLIEQILASHSFVEGTMELPDIPALAARIGVRPGGLVSVDAGELQALGFEYLERTRVHRKSDKPYFIDKLPNNWAHIGLIQLILPNAKIIDARRHPMACCFSNFKQHFARGQSFSYGLTDVGLYYRDYVRLMSHFDEVLPGRVVRVIHEQLIDESDVQIRKLLQALDLPFEEACLRPHENARAVRTASSEQVRQPINRSGLDQWLPFDPWLAPLRQALGSIVNSYPAAPSEL
jgi:tetratricopeptide (TPR) repeat protein